MNDILGIMRLSAYLFALPLVATAAASAHQWAAVNAPITITEMPAAIESARVNAELQPTLQDHVVGKNEMGEVVGQVAVYNASQIRSGLRNLSIYFVQSGKIVEETRTDRNGGFKVGGLKDGAYSLIAAGDAGFAVVGLNVVSDAEPSQANVFEVTAATPEFGTIKRLLSEFVSSDLAMKIAGNATPDAANNEVAASSRIWLTEDGRMNGRVISLTQQLSGSTSVALIKGDQVVAETKAGQDGVFQLEGLKPGVYDVIATGPDGVSVVSIQAVANGAVKEVYTSLTTFHSSAIAPTADLVLADAGDSRIVNKSIEYYTQVEPVSDTITYDSAPMAVVGDEMAMGTACGSCGGGGGGAVGGGRRLGLLALLAGVAVPLAVTSNSGPKSPSEP